MMTRPLLKECEVLELLKISRATLNRWISEERFPASIKLGGGRRGAIRWDHTAIDEWLSSRSKGAA